MTELLTEDDILKRKEALLEAAAKRNDDYAGNQQEAAQGFRYVRPFSAACDGVIEALENPKDRFTLGLGQIDVLTRGFGPKELILVAGFSHAGKTQLINTAILNNRDKRILFFSMDDPSEMILIKLVCMQLGVDAETLERNIRDGDARSKAALREAATQVFDNLVVVDDSLSITEIDRALKEAVAYWNGEQPHVVIIDYLGSMQGEGSEEDGGIKRKVSALKRWCKKQAFPTVLVHQNTRSRGGPGEPVTMMSIAFGGEQEATMLIGVRRKKDNPELDGWVRDTHAHTVTLHVAKNKRPPGKLTPHDGVDLFMCPKTGLIRALRDEDIPVRQGPLTKPEEAWEQARRIQQDAQRGAAA